ncbi:short-chain dehydrogenase/reductase [Tricladium varicosporioides]|nr:short-chain dehydrogenase/reductase [Hymenoscyphus varicosporioides]
MDAASLYNVDGLVAVITGGGSGLGLVMAKALEANGAAKVYIVGRTLEKLEKAAKQSKYGNIIPLQGDVTSKESLATIAKRVEGEVGFVNLLIANAGLASPGQLVFDISPQSSIEEISEYMLSRPWEAYTEQFNIHFTSTLYTCLSFLTLLKSGNATSNLPFSSQIIATGSAQAFNKNPLSGFGYSASKAAETHLIKSLAFYLAPNNIRCNVLSPGFYRSDMTASAIEMFEDKGMNGKRERGKEENGGGDVKIPAFVSPMGRAGREEEIAGIILMMAGKSGAYMNGGVVLSDGGRLTSQPSVV